MTVFFRESEKQPKSTFSIFEVQGSEKVVGVDSAESIQKKFDDDASYASQLFGVAVAANLMKHGLDVLVMTNPTDKSR